VFTARYGLIPYMKHVTFRLLKVKLPLQEHTWNTTVAVQIASISLNHFRLQVVFTFLCEWQIERLLFHYTTIIFQSLSLTCTVHTLRLLTLAHWYTGTLVHWLLPRHCISKSITFIHQLYKEISTFLPFSCLYYVNFIQKRIIWSCALLF
jgi:hypothetical protein